MSKQKLAEMVMQKMLEKKAREQANRPHYEVLQLMVQFNVQQNTTLKQDIRKLQQEIAGNQTANDNLEKHCQQLENTGKKDFPRIIIKPQFIASENIPILIKQFYRKSANSFLKKDILRKKAHQQFLQKQESIKRMICQINETQQKLRTKLAEHVTTERQKRVKVLKQDLRLRFIKDEQCRLQGLIQNQRMENIELIKEYDIKKNNLDNRIAYSQQLDRRIQDQKDIIERTYNPVAYREYLRLIFLIRAKNQKLKKNLFEAIAKIESLNQNTEKTEKYLVSTQSFLLYGRTYDSPSRNPGRRQKQRMRQLNNNKDQQQTRQVRSIKKRKQSEHKPRDLSSSRFQNTIKTSRSMSNINASHSKNASFSKSIGNISTAAKSTAKKQDF